MTIKSLTPPIPSNFKTSKNDFAGILPQCNAALFLLLANAAISLCVEADMLVGLQKEV